MTWFGWVLIALYGFSVAHSLIRSADGGYTADYTSGVLLIIAVFQALILLGIILVGTGAV